MLSIKRIFALNDSGMNRYIQVLCSTDESIYHVYICHRRIFYRGILLRCAFHPHRTCCNNYITTHYIRLHAPTCANPNKSVRPSVHKLLKSYRRRWSTYSSGCHADLLSVQIPRVCNKFPAVRHEFRIVKISCNRLASLGITRHYHIPPYHVLINFYMILKSLFRFIYHINPSCHNLFRQQEKQACRKSAACFSLLLIPLLPIPLLLVLLGKLSYVSYKIST